jgi:hypothetical protein
MYIRPGLGGGFILKMDDTSDDENSDEEVEMFLTNDDLKTIIDRLSERLKP